MTEALTPANNTIVLDDGTVIRERGTGYETRTTPRGVFVITMDAWADPTKRGSKEFWEQAQKKQPSKKDFRREYQRDWTSPAGDAYYPEFVLNGGTDTYVFDPPGLLDGPILRPWDFGIRHPAILFCQLDVEHQRLFILRELMPGWMALPGASEFGIDIRSFRDTVHYLSGEWPLEALNTRAMNLVQNIHEEPSYPTPPWIPPSPALPWQFLDFAGPEVDYTSDMPEHDSQAVTRAQVLAETGIQIQKASNSFEASEDIIRELLRVRKPCDLGHGSDCEGHPGLLVSKHCPILIKGLSGGICYPKPTPQNPLPINPAKDGYFEHLHDCLRYLCTAIFPSNKGRKQPPLPDEFQGRRHLSREETMARQETLGWSEMLAARRVR